MIKKLSAEFLGTMLLVFFGCGIASMFGSMGRQGTLTIAIAFGIVLMAVVYIFGKISGAHVNPAVSLAMLLTGRISFKDFICYAAAQFLGAIAGAAALAPIFENGNLGSNVFGDLVSWGGYLPWYAAFIVEGILTFMFVSVVLFVASDKRFDGIAGLVIGFGLTLVHIFGIQFTGTSVNPARSFGPAFVTWLVKGGEASGYIKQSWLFIAAPLVGAAIAAVVYIFFRGCCCKRCKEKTHAQISE